MEFSEKLSALLSLTATKNVSLARAINIDAAQISRMRTGVRKMPAKTSLVRDIANYLARRFDSDYRLSALYELTSDVRLQTTVDEFVLTNIIYDWLISPDIAPKNQVGRFLDRFEEFSMHNLQESLSEPENRVPKLGNTGFLAYYNNEGKRQAVRDLAAYILGLDRPCTIRVFTDECMDWILEDSSFTRELVAYVGQMAQKDCKIQRIRPPEQSIENSFRSIERWLPAYMAGTLKLFYYPWARDELHRRTIIAVPGHIALHSNSLCGQKETPMTILTTDKMTVQLTDEHYSRILERCRTLMSTYTLEKLGNLTERLEDLSKIENFGICKSSRLSVHTMPPELLTSIRRRGTPCVQKMCDCYEKSAIHRAKVLENHKITDIICFPGLNAVLKGEAVVPGTKMSPADCLCYTPEEYRMHLEHILWYLNTFPNYQAVILDEPLFENITMYVKGDDRTLLIKEADPFALFEIAEQRLTAALCDYLRRLMGEGMQVGSRRVTVERLKQELQKLAESI
jgi:hypothetical protein